MKTLGIIVLVIAVPMAFRTFAPAAKHRVPIEKEVAVEAPVTPGQPSDAWRQGPLWDDSRAEYSLYDVQWRRYGHLFPGRVMMITVKELWAPDLDVKADRPRLDSYDVIKLNFMRDVPTGIYTYHQMASVFVRRDSGALVKLAASSTEACGISTAHMVDGRLQMHSYFDGQGDREMPWPADAVSEDALPISLRDYVQGTPPSAIDVFPSLLTGRFAKPEPARWTVTKNATDHDTTSVPAGTFACVALTLSRGDDSQTYLFEKAAPHRLIRFEKSDGTVYRLAKSSRLAYWNMHAPGDENWLPKGLR